MYIPESCAKCLYDKQANKVKDERYLARVREILDNRAETDTSPYMVYCFNKVYVELFGKLNSYADEKRKYNDLVLEIEDRLRSAIENDEDPLAKAFSLSRVGNYIDFGAMNTVDENIFTGLIKQAGMSEKDKPVYERFLSECGRAKKMCYMLDNSGEVVLDKLFIEQLHKTYPQLEITAFVRGAEILNDVTREDAHYVGIDKMATIMDNSMAVAGTIYEYLTDEAKAALDGADVVFAKGQGNYETMSRTGRHVFYSFLCKCDYFTEKFSVPRLTGMFVEEGVN